MTDEELDRLRRELKELSAQQIYTTMPGHAERMVRHRELVELVRGEEARRESMSGLALIERQLHDAREMVDANRRMAEATAAAARWTKYAAVFTAIAAGASLIGVIIQAATMRR